MKIEKIEEDQSCQTFNLQFQRGIGPPPQTPLRRKMSGKKSTNRVSFRRKILSTVVTIIFSIKKQGEQKNSQEVIGFSHFQSRATREEESGSGLVG